MLWAALHALHDHIYITHAQDEDLKKLLQTSIKTKKKNKKSGKKALGENGAEGV